MKMKSDGIEAIKNFVKVLQTIWFEMKKENERRELVRLMCFN